LDITPVSISVPPKYGYIGGYIDFTNPGSFYINLTIVGDLEGGS